MLNTGQGVGDTRHRANIIFLCQLEGDRSVNKELRQDMVCTVSEVFRREIGATQTGLVNSASLGEKGFFKVFVKEVLIFLHLA